MSPDILILPVASPSPVTDAWSTFAVTNSPRVQARFFNLSYHLLPLC